MSSWKSESYHPIQFSRGISQFAERKPVSVLSESKCIHKKRPFFEIIGDKISMFLIQLLKKEIIFLFPEEEVSVRKDKFENFAHNIPR